MTHFNLVIDPWIPVRYVDASSKLVSLERLFKDCASIADLDCQAHERISLMRLLVCITQAELGAPDSPEEWGDFGSDLESRAVAYLKRPDIHPHFNLFGDGSRFLQVAIDPSDSEPVKASKLFPQLATNNNPTLFDHDGGTPVRVFESEKLALALLVFQNFYPLYGAGYRGKGPCVDGNMLHSLVYGAHLKETIIANCLTKDFIGEFFPQGIGKPIWEFNLNCSDDLSAALASYLGRLVPRHRSLFLLPTCDFFLIKQEGLEYPRFEAAREPSATIVISSKKDVQERKLLAAKLDKAIWRDLHLLTILRQSKSEDQKAPFAVQIQWQRGITGFCLWAGALVTDMKAKILDVVESTITVPVSLLNDRGRAHYESGITFADMQSNQLYGAVKQNGAALKNENPPTDEAKKQFWHALEAQCTVLLQIAGTPDILNGLSFGEGHDDWTVAVRRAAKKAYDQVCPRQTPRQMQAYATGLKVLFPKPKKKKAATT